MPLEQKDLRMEIAQIIMLKTTKMTFLKKVITAMNCGFTFDRYDPEIKPQSYQWKMPEEQRPKKIRQ